MTIKQAIAELREAMLACIDSLEYVDSLPGVIAGYGVRKERIVKARKSLVALTALESSVEGGTVDMEKRIAAAAEEISRELRENYEKGTPITGWDAGGLANLITRHIQGGKWV